MAGHKFKMAGTTPDTLLHLQATLICEKCGVSRYSAQKEPEDRPCPFDDERKKPSGVASLIVDALFIEGLVVKDEVRGVLLETVIRILKATCGHD